MKIDKKLPQRTGIKVSKHCVFVIVFLGGGKKCGSSVFILLIWTVYCLKTKTIPK